MFKDLSKFFNVVFYYVIGRWKVRVHGSAIKNELVYSTTIEDTYLEFYCQEIFYTMHFNKWYIPDRTIKTYKYHVNIDPNAPEELKKKCKVKVIFPDFAPWFLKPREKKLHMLNVYLDIINLKVDELEEIFSDFE